MILLVLLAQPLPDGDKNVALDDERLQDGVPKGLQKVELDLDDALFLEFEDKEEEPPPPPEPEPQAELQVKPESQAAPKGSRKKFLILGIAAALCLVLGAGGAYFFMRSSPEKPEAQPSEARTAQPEQEPGPSAKPEEALPTESGNATKPPLLVTHTLERFQIEFALADQIRILTFTLSIPNVTELMRLEMQAKSVLIRDGVYRYLKNAPLAFLDNPENSGKLKSDLATVINQHMKSGTVSEILIEEYVVR